MTSLLISVSGSTLPLWLASTEVGETSTSRLAWMVAGGLIAAVTTQVVGYSWGTFRPRRYPYQDREYIGRGAQATLFIRRNEIVLVDGSSSYELIPSDWSVKAGTISGVIQGRTSRSQVGAFEIERGPNPSLPRVALTLSSNAPRREIDFDPTN